MTNFFKRIALNLKNKRAGFYVGLGGALLGIVGMIIYASTYRSTEYYSAWVVVLPILAALAFVGLSLFQLTTPYASAAMVSCSFVGFLLLIKAVYMIFSDAFFGGVNADAIASLDPRFVSVLVLYLFAAIAGNVALYLKQGVQGGAENE